ncbi:hypothetical protein Agub_g9749, partial [Astrephomene gubernaculifera]
MPPRKKARPAERAAERAVKIEEKDLSLSTSHAGTHIYDLGDCLHVVAKYLPLNSCLRSRLVSTTFADAFGWAVQELMQVVASDPDAVLRGLARCGSVYPAANSLMLVLDGYEHMPGMQAVVEQLRLQGPAGRYQQRGATETAAPAAGVTSGAEPQAAGPGPGARAAAAAMLTDSNCQASAEAGNNTGNSPAAASVGAGADGSSSDGSGSGGSSPPAVGPVVCLPRVTRLVLRCNTARSETAKERQKYKERHTRGPAGGLLQLLGLPPGLIEALQQHQHPEGGQQGGGQQGQQGQEG